MPDIPAIIAESTGVYDLRINLMSFEICEASFLISLKSLLTWPILQDAKSSRIMAINVPLIMLPVIIGLLRMDRFIRTKVRIIDKGISVLPLNPLAPPLGSFCARGKGTSYQII